MLPHFLLLPPHCSALPQEVWDLSDLVLFEIGVEYVSNTWKRRPNIPEARLVYPPLGVVFLYHFEGDNKLSAPQGLAPSSDIWHHVQVMSSHTLVQPAIPLLLFSFPSPPPHPNPSIPLHPNSSPSPSTPLLPVLHPFPPSSTVWTGGRELWPFFHTPPAGADPSRWGSDSEPGPGRVPGILLYQPRVPRKCCYPHCRRAGLISAHARTRGTTYTNIYTITLPNINSVYTGIHTLTYISVFYILEMICAVTGTRTSTQTILHRHYHIFVVHTVAT